jgi:hypothetical protein
MPGIIREAAAQPGLAGGLEGDAAGRIISASDRRAVTPVEVTRAVFRKVPLAAAEGTTPGLTRRGSRERTY